MNQGKIGNYISEKRKEKKLTQEELKRLLCYIEDYKKNNSIDPNFINYEEEIYLPKNTFINGILEEKKTVIKLYKH